MVSSVLFARMTGIPHYIHNLDNLIRFGGLFPPIHVHADIRRTRLLGVTHVAHEGVYCWYVARMISTA
jgi:hypothetical protein